VSSTFKSCRGPRSTTCANPDHGAATQIKQPHRVTVQTQTTRYTLAASDGRTRNNVAFVVSPKERDKAAHTIIMTPGVGSTPTRSSQMGVEPSQARGVAPMQRAPRPFSAPFQHALPILAWLNEANRLIYSRLYPKTPDTT